MGKFVDLTGRRFGLLSVCCRISTKKNGGVVWECRCECGNHTAVLSSLLRSGNTRSCGCLLGSPHDLTDMRFEHLLVVARAGSYSDGSALWRCLCDCGQETVAVSSLLRKGSTKSCGCVTRARNAIPLTGDRLRQLLIYDPASGLFECVDGTLSSAHRLAWLYMTGAWPTGQIDHINGDPRDNRWLNLRQVNQSQNNANSKLSSRNTTGHKGVTFHKKAKKWMAQISYRGKPMYLGLYDTMEEAAEARRAKATHLFGEFARH